MAADNMEIYKQMQGRTQILEKTTTVRSRSVSRFVFRLAYFSFGRLFSLAAYIRLRSIKLVNVGPLSGVGLIHKGIMTKEAKAFSLRGRPRCKVSAIWGHNGPPTRPYKAHGRGF
nr:hypothetical protein [Pandoravirus massiliensis]